MKRLQALISLVGFLGVLLGALGAHGKVAELVDGMGRIDEWKTGIFYHMVHVLAAWLALISNASRASVLFLIGVVFFSGSLYMLSVTGITKFGAITPIGGLILLIGWIQMFLISLRK